MDDKYLFVILLEDCTEQRAGSTLISRHIEFLKGLDRSGALILCGTRDLHGALVTN